MYESMSDTLFNKAFFQATHNSYSKSSDVRSIEEQLASGIRCLELDIHYDDGTFTIGHDSTGDDVLHQGNTSSDNLEDWLGLVVKFAKANPGHDPIMLYLDAKEDLTSQLHDLNHMIKSVFKRRLFTAAKYKKAGWRSVARLRGKIIVILSGDYNTRAKYADPDNYKQRLFVESKKDDSDSIPGAQFYAAAASSDAQSGNPSWVQSKQNAGKIVRLWQFTSGNTGGTAPNLAATDTPYDDWYTCYSFQRNAFTDIITNWTFKAFDKTEIKLPIAGPNGADTLYVVNGVVSFTFKGRCGPDYNSWTRFTIRFPAFNLPSGHVVDAMAIAGPVGCKSTSGTMIGWSVENTSATSQLWPPIVINDPNQRTQFSYQVTVRSDIAVFCSSSQYLIKMACQLLIFAKSLPTDPLTKG